MSITDESAEELLRRGLELLGAGESLGALPMIEKSYQMRATPVNRSYYGLLVAIERGKLTEGLELCRASVDEDSENPVHYLNLGRVLYKAGMKKEAIQTVRRGLSRGYNNEAEDWLMGLGIRKKPVFPFLPRKHFINKYLGMVLHKLGIR